jgi:hypothetical protein
MDASGFVNGFLKGSAIGIVLLLAIALTLHAWSNHVKIEQAKGWHDGFKACSAVGDHQVEVYDHGVTLCGCGQEAHPCLCREYK